MKEEIIANVVIVVLVILIFGVLIYRIGKENGAVSSFDYIASSCHDKSEKAMWGLWPSNKLRFMTIDCRGVAVLFK